MRDIKIKPDMDKPKALTKNFTPKDAASLQKKKLEQQKTAKEPEERDGVRYATDKTEHGMRNGTLLAADLSRRMGIQALKQCKSRKENTDVPTTPPQAEPPQSLPMDTEREAVPAVHATQPSYKAKPVPQSPHTQENREPSAATPQSGRGSVSTPPQNQKAAPQERGRQKAIQDAKPVMENRPPSTTKRFAASSETTPPTGAVRSSSFVGRVEPKTVASGKGQILTTRRAVAPTYGVFPPKRSGTPSSPVAGKYTPQRSVTTQTTVFTARAFAQRKAQRKMLQTTAHQSKTTAHKLGGMAVQAGKAVGRAATSAVSSIATFGGGAVVLVLLLTVILVAALVASPFGILFSGESREPGTVPVSAAVAQVNYDFNAALEALQTAENYDTISVTGQAADWVEVLAVFAVKVAGSDTDAADVATIDADRIERLKAVFWDMTTIEHEVEVIRHPGTEDEEGWTERNLFITISAKTAEEMKTAYHFNRHQIAALEELLSQRELLLELIEDTYAINSDTAKLLRNLPDDLSPERAAVVRVACSLVGKVNYFWGGKSGAIGWDSRWGMVTQVTAAGSSTSGTYRPYGLDCSGFVDWVFNNAHGYVIGHGGGAMMQHAYCTNLSWEDAQPGDLVFYPEDTHVGIVGGWDEDGTLLIIHCASSANNVVITGSSGFTAIGRPIYYSE